MTKREEFEKRFPVPKGIEWINDAQGYRITSDDDYWWDTEGQAYFRGYLGQWLGWQAAREQEGVKPNGKNEFGLDARYFHGKLGLILRDIRSYTPSEMARALGRLAVTASSETMREPEFNTHPPQSQGVPEAIKQKVVDVLQYRWNDWCEDTGCIPDDFEIKGPPTTQVYFEASTWAYRVAEDIASLISTPAAPQADSFQDRVEPWLLECFGKMIAGDREERNHRFLEEALELVQACDCTADEAHKLVDYVYGRDVGDPPQEVGGVMVTLAALCLASDMDMHDCGEGELVRITQPETVKKIREKQKRKPSMSPLPGVYPERPQPPEQEGER